MNVRNPTGLIYSVVKAKGNTRVGVIRYGLVLNLVLNLVLEYSSGGLEERLLFVVRV